MTSPLRDHPEDIPILARHFMQKYAGEMCKQIDTIPQDALQALVKWSWPGNVRELENFIERAVILTQGASLRAPLAELRLDAAEAPGDIRREKRVPPPNHGKKPVKHGKLPVKPPGAPPSTPGAAGS
jgi:DNA-binding NtrC family response regulator